MTKSRISMTMVGLLIALAATSASATVIDSSVRDALAGKATGETVPLLMILNDPADLSADRKSVV